MANWKELKMKEKADLISLFVDNGITDINEITSLYNSYAEYYPMVIKTQENTQQTSTDNTNIKEEVQNNEYSTIEPSQYIKELQNNNIDILDVGKLINISENPDSIGFDAVNRRWYAPPKKKLPNDKYAFDVNNFGMGVDRNENKYIEDKIHKDSKGRDYITEEDERKARHSSIIDAATSATNRLAYAQKVLKNNGNVSKVKMDILTNMIYNLGQRKVAKKYFDENTNREFMNIFLNGTDSEFIEAVNNIFTNENKANRADQVNKYYNIHSSKDGGFLQRLRKRIYDNVSPTSYNDFEDNWKRFVENRKNIPHNNLGDDIFATYLSIPEEDRNLGKRVPRLQESKYLPSKGNVEKAYSLPLTDKDKESLIAVANGLQLDYNQNKNTSVLDNYNLGTHTIGRGYDDKGEYISYYDSWDLNPYKGIFGIRNSDKQTKLQKNIQTFLENFNLIDKEDLSFGIGTPVDIYDRVYLDDYYNIPEEYRGGYWLNPAVVTADSSKKNGGKLKGHKYINEGE